MKRALFILLRNPLSVLGLTLVGLVVLAAVFADYVAPFPDHKGAVVDFLNFNKPPEWPYLFGTDLVGRDILSRILFAYRISLTLGVVVLALAVPVGVTVGLIAGYIGGRTEFVLMRLTDVFLSIPPLVLAMSMMGLLEPSLTNGMMADKLQFGGMGDYPLVVNGYTFQSNPQSKSQLIAVAADRFGFAAVGS